ncbi:Serine carboxypeptidase-like 26 [Glycine soja]
MNMKMNVILCLQFLCFFLLSTLFIKASAINVETYESDRIIDLPGQPSSPSVSHFSGYITVNENHGRALFYWFFEAQSEPSKKPLLLWLNGGPGCSSIGYGGVVEIGPLIVNKNGEGLHFNTHSWNQEANLLFVESPVGVGFSYTNTSSDLTKLEDNFVAEDAYIFLVNWLQRFPQFKSRDFFISGESYGGHYIPQLAELIFDRNKDGSKYPFINLKGFIVGNPETDDYYDYKGLLEYAWSHAVISDQQYDKAKQVCDFKQFDWSNECNKAMNEVFQDYSEIDIYNIYAPSCLLNSTSSIADDSNGNGPESFTKERNDYRLKRMRIFGGYDPCYSNYVEEYFNRKDVQSSFHADTKRDTNVAWKVCNNSILRTYNFSVFSVLPVYTKLIKGGLKIWIYSGDADGRVPVIGTRYCVEALGLPLKSRWRTWYHDNQVGGRIVEYEGLTYVTVRGAASAINVETYESDRIIDLPGQPSSPSVSHFSGYITVNENHGRTLFYWLFEAQSEPSKKPLLLWLNGGPGCSSVGSGAVVEIGPLIVNKKWGRTTFQHLLLESRFMHIYIISIFEFCAFHYLVEANLLFVESPVGVGFFYTNTSSDFTILEDNFVVAIFVDKLLQSAEDTYNFLVNWLQRFPQFKSREFFISGESYGGHYIPQLAELIFDRNKDRNKYPSINLKGFIVGNPETGDYYDYKGVLEYAWSHAVISDQQYDKAKQLCDFKQFDWPNECNKAMNEVFLDYSEIDIFNIYAPACRLNSTSSIADHSNSNNPESSTKERNDYRLRMRIFGGYDPCYSNYAEEYFSRKDVQSFFHVDIRRGTNINVTWKVCNNFIFEAYNISVFGSYLSTPNSSRVGLRYGFTVETQMAEYQ